MSSQVENPQRPVHRARVSPPQDDAGPVLGGAAGWLCVIHSLDPWKGCVHHDPNRIGSQPVGGRACRVEAYQLLGDLSVLVYRLPQCLAQLARQLDDWHTAGRVHIDPGTEFADNPALAIETATSYLRDDAVPHAEQLAAALNQAQQSLAYASYADDTAGGEVDA